MSYSRENYRRDTLYERLQLHIACQSMSERQAIDEVFPTLDRAGRRINTNRMAKLNTWRRRGVWPLSQRDLDEAMQVGLLNENLDITANTEASENCDEIRAFMRSSVRRRPTEPRPWLQEKLHTTHVGARCPIDIATELKAIPGTATEHIVQALSMYLDALKENAD